MPVAPHTVVVGAGIGGLTAAALLVDAGHRVTVLEAQAYPGGCAGTFAHRGFRFDAGATLAGGFGPGQPHARVGERLGIDWPVDPVDPAWLVHMPDGAAIAQWSDPVRWAAERVAAFPGAAAERFWRAQERLADASWRVAAAGLPWPPESVGDARALVAAVWREPAALRAAPLALRTVGDLLPAGEPRLRAFVDANLLIAAQCTSDEAGALYGSAALDLPRRGVRAVRGGIGGIAGALAAWIERRGGRVLYGRPVEAIVARGGRAVAVRARRRPRGRAVDALACDAVVANVTPWALAALLGSAAPRRLRHEVRRRPPTWGAFALHVGLDAAALPADAPSHHLVLADGAGGPGEGHTVFVSLSAPGDADRAPDGFRAATLSTHTAVAPWWALRNEPAGPDGYLARRADYAECLLGAAERALPGFRAAVRLCLPATPVTYASWTGRPRGMVGGFPQGSLLGARGPGTGVANVRLVGDSVFPGQSTAGVTLGALRVAESLAAARR